MGTPLEPNFERSMAPEVHRERIFLDLLSEVLLKRLHGDYGRPGTEKSCSNHGIVVQKQGLGKFWKSHLEGALGMSFWDPFGHSWRHISCRRPPWGGSARHHGSDGFPGSAKTGCCPIVARVLPQDPGPQDTGYIYIYIYIYTYRYMVI